MQDSCVLPTAVISGYFTGRHAEIVANHEPCSIFFLQLGHWHFTLSL